jgi:hypothetical protein
MEEVGEVKNIPLIFEIKIQEESCSGNVLILKIRTELYFHAWVITGFNSMARQSHISSSIDK